LQPEVTAAAAIALTIDLQFGTSAERDRTKDIAMTVLAASSMTLSLLQADPFGCDRHRYRRDALCFKGQSPVATVIAEK